MPRIVQLPSVVVNQIAAGEVIERPSSVVKELLENSIDAGAKRVDIELEQGGTERIALVDDGHGIEPEDLPLAFASHATSKLRNAADLAAIRSLGFRGEALASIGSIARVTIQSRAAGFEHGASIECNGGELSAVQPWNGAPGTRIEVKHLFFNTPVRRKFLKSQTTEVGHAAEAVTKVALGQPGTHLTLKHNGRMIVEVPGSAGLRERIGILCGEDVAKALYPVHHVQGPIKITGFIADPSCDRGNAKLQYLFLNGRWFRDRSLGHALQEAYRGLLMVGRYSVGFLFLEIPAEMADVNVHPTKAEVRFQDAQILYQIIRGTVKQTLADRQLIPQMSLPEGVPNAASPQPANLFLPSAAAVPAWQPPAAYPQYLPPPPTFPSFPSAPLPSSEAMESASETPGEKPIILSSRAFQIHDSYLVLETTEGMMLIDQHALHERILFEQLRKRIAGGNLEVQRLLIPEPIDLPLEQAAMVLDAKDDLKALGWDIGDFGTGTILLQSYPALLKRGMPGEWFRGVVDALVAKDRVPSREQLFNDILATMACKAAVKAGDPLTAEEISYLMELRDMAEDSHHCPHGRPTSLLFSHKDLEKQFKRI